MGGFADDTMALMDHLGINDFSVLGISGGGPFALAIAYAGQKLGNRVTDCCIVDGIGPIHAIGGTSGMMFMLRFIFFVGRFKKGYFLQKLFGPQRKMRVTNAD